MEEMANPSPNDELHRCLRPHSRNYIQAYAIGVFLDAEIALFFKMAGSANAIAAGLIVLLAAATSVLVIRLRQKTMELNAALRLKVFVSLDVQGRFQALRALNGVVLISGGGGGYWGFSCLRPSPDAWSHNTRCLSRVRDCRSQYRSRGWDSLAPA